MRKVREGHLEQNIEIKTTTPEIVSLMKSYNQMIDHMRILVLEVKNTTENLFTTSRSLETSSSAVQNTTSDLLRAIEVVNEGAKQTAASSVRSSSTFQTMSKHIEKVIVRVNNLNSSSQETLASTEEMSQISEKQLKFTGENYTISKRLKDVSASLQELTTTFKL